MPAVKRIFSRWLRTGNRASFMQRIMLFSLIAVLAAGCGGRQQDSATTPHDSYPNSQAFLSGIKSYPYAASAERRVRIIEGAKVLHRCTTKDEVSRLLGAPDYSEISYGPKGAGARRLESSWTFYISKQSDIVNLKDPRIEIFFDSTDQAHWLVPTGIEGASEIGAPDVVCTKRRPT